MMLAAPFTAGVGIYTFYALQPYLLELYGDPDAYAVAGLAAAIVAGSQILGGYAAPRIRALFGKRTSALILGAVASAAILVLLALVNSFWVALALLVVWGLVFAANMPIRQAYLNDMIPSQQRATVLSFDSLMGTSGGVVIQPVLGKAADVDELRDVVRVRRALPAARGAVPLPEPARGRRGRPGRQPGRANRADRADRGTPS